MFSRTTMASSISRPTHRLNAISVTMFSEKPNRSMKKKVPTSAMGSVRPVMTVERQEFRNRKTMPTVSKAPSTSVRCTLATATRMGRELSRTTSTAMPGGSSFFSACAAFCRPSTTSMVFSPWFFTTSRAIMRWPLKRASDSTSSGPSTTSATCHSLMGWGEAPRRATTMSRNSSGRLTAPSICTMRSDSRLRSAPAGRSRFSVRKAATTWSAPTPSASIAAGLR